jgi:hypothetical protein
LQRHTRELSAQPENWMPWNYRYTFSRDLAPANSTS